MIATFRLSNLHEDEHLVLPEPQYPVCVPMHSAKMEVLIPQGLC